MGNFLIINFETKSSVLYKTNYRLLKLETEYTEWSENGKIHNILVIFILEQNVITKFYLELLTFHGYPDFLFEFSKLLNSVKQL